MKQASLLALAAVAALLGCEGREVPVFELPAMVGGGGQGGNGGAANPSGGGAGAASAGTAAGADTTVGGAGAPNGGGAGGGAGLGPVTEGGGAGAPVVTMMGPPCASKDDCQPGWVCDKHGCDAAFGTCVPWSSFCDPMGKPVCGCDGVTYWNDCLRLSQLNPTALAGPDQCRATACTCEVGADCNVPYASCSHLLPPGEMCGHGMGACWVLPPQCDPSLDPKRWRECKPPPDGVAPRCIDTCTAIATEHSYAELHRGEMCN